MAALACFQQAGALGYTDALCVLGEMYFFGQHVPRDLDMAVAYFRQTAARDHTVGLFYLGYILVFCVPTAAGHVEGAQYLQQAALRNEPDAQFFLSECYAGGLGVPRSRTRARVWLLRAADRGSRHALASRVYRHEAFTMGRAASFCNTTLPVVLASARRAALPPLPPAVWCMVFSFLRRADMRLVPPSGESESDSEESSSVSEDEEDDDDVGDDDDDDNGAAAAAAAATT